MVGCTSDERGCNAVKQNLMQQEHKVDNFKI
jgi:hypothetical protein